MSKEKIQSLSKYSSELKSKLSDKTVPEKHKNRPVAYKRFLENELAAVTSKIDSLKMTGAPEAKK